MEIVDHLIVQLEQNIARGLPGRESHFEMAPTSRRFYREAPHDARTACVLALFYPKDNQHHLVLIERQSKNDMDKHKGQISFPGGKMEMQDATLQDTALREAEEEVGINASDVRIVGAMTDLYIPVSNFKVFPFIGVLPYAPQFKPQLSEVKSIIETPFDHFLNKENRKMIDLKVSPRITMKEVPYFSLDGKTIWGATAMILNELAHLYPAQSIS